MHAWKLRVAVYGALSAIAALLIWQSGAFAGQPPDPLLLEGSTVSGSAVRVTIAGTHVLSFRVEHMGNVCDGSYPFSWSPTRGQANVEWRQSGRDLSAHESPDPRFPGPRRWELHTYMRERVTPDGRRISGDVWFSARRGTRSCDSPLTAFSATR